MNVDPQRIVALFADARQRFGEAVLRDPRRLVPMLSDQAPEMRGAIKATAAALAAGAMDRLRTSRDPAADVQRIAQEISASDGVNAHDALAGVQVAAQLGAMFAPPAGPPATMPPTPTPRAPPGQTEWVGVSTAAGMPATPSPPQAAQQPQVPPPPYPPLPPAPAAHSTTGLKWAIGVVAVIGALSAYHLGGGGRSEPPQQPPPREQPPQAGPPPQGQPPQQRPPQGQPPRGGSLPMIAAPDSGQLPTLTPNDGGQAWVFVFLAPAGQQPLRVMIGVSKQGWGAGLMAVSTVNAQPNEPESLSTPGPFQLNRQGNEVYRVLKPQWQRDGLNIGGACVVFAGSGQDVQLQNSKLCILSDNCQRMIGCGVVQ